MKKNRLSTEDNTKLTDFFKLVRKEEWEIQYVKKVVFNETIFPVKDSIELIEPLKLVPAKKTQQ